MHSIPLCSFLMHFLMLYLPHTFGNHNIEFWRGENFVPILNLDMWRGGNMCFKTLILTDLACVTWGLCMKNVVERNSY